MKNTKISSADNATTQGRTVSVVAVAGGSARKPYACVGCGKTIGVRSRYYDEGVCYMCIRLDSRGGAYREYSRKKHRGMRAFRGRAGMTTHLG